MDAVLAVLVVSCYKVVTVYGCSSTVLVCPMYMQVKNLFSHQNPSDLGELEFDELSGNTSMSGSYPSTQEDWPLPGLSCHAHVYMYVCIPSIAFACKQVHSIGIICSLFKSRVNMKKAVYNLTEHFVCSLFCLSV